MQFRLSSLDDFFHLKVNIYTYAMPFDELLEVLLSEVRVLHYGLASATDILAKARGFLSISV